MRTFLWIIFLFCMIFSLTCSTTQNKSGQVILPKMIVLPDSASNVVMTGVEKLVLCFEEIGHSLDIISESDYLSKQPAGSVILIGLYSESKIIQELDHTTITNLTENKVGKEGYFLSVTPNSRSKAKIILISSFGERGLLYGSFKLSSVVESNQGVPADLAVVTKPFFPIREWQAHTFSGCFNLPLNGAFDRPPEELLALTKKIIHQAPHYGINALILAGGPGGGIDLSWFLKYRKYPKLYQNFKYDHARDERVRLIREIANECHKYGLELLLWDHELIYPAQLLDFYPEMRGNRPIKYDSRFKSGMKGERYPIKYQSMLELINNKVDECFEIAPEVDGLVLTYSEVGREGHNLFQSGSQAIHDVAMVMYDACKRNGKRLEVRSYCESGEAARLMEAAIKNTPKDMIIMSKCVPYDFFGTRRLHNPIFGKVSNMHIAEFTCCREDNGHGFIPGIAPLHYKQKLEYEIDKGIVGVAARLDYSLQYSHALGFNPGLAQTTFDRPNEFDVVALSSMMWNPKVDIDSLWMSWAAKKYGEKAATHVVSALKRTEDITQKTFFLQDEYIIHQHNQVTDLDRMKRNLSGPKTQSFWDPSNQVLKERLEKIKHPNEDILAEFMNDKEEAILLADSSLADLLKAQPYMHKETFQSLYRSMQIEREAAVLWSYIAEMFFRYLMWEQGTSDQDANIERLHSVGQAYLIHAQSIEDRFGRTWPIYRAARGVYAYYEILEFWRPLLLKIITETSEMEQIWDAISKLFRPQRVSDLNKLRVMIPGDIDKIEFFERNMIVHSKSNQMVKIPTGIEVQGNDLIGFKSYFLTFQRKTDKVIITANEL